MRIFHDGNIKVDSFKKEGSEGDFYSISRDAYKDEMHGEHLYLSLEDCISLQKFFKDVRIVGC